MEYILSNCHFSRVPRPKIIPSPKSKKTPKPRRSLKAVAREREALGLPKRKRGGQPGNINRMTHGRYSGYYLARRAFVQGLLRDTRFLIARLKLERKMGLSPVEGLPCFRSRSGDRPSPLPLGGGSNTHDRAPFASLAGKNAVRMPGSKSADGGARL